MIPATLSPADTARAKLARPHAQYTRDECAAIVGTKGVDHGALGKATPAEIAGALFQFIGPRPAVVERMLIDGEGL